MISLGLLGFIWQSSVESDMKQGKGHMQRGVKGQIQTLAAASGSWAAYSTSWAISALGWKNCLTVHKIKKKLTNLLVVGEAAHDSGVNDAAEHHGQRVDGQRAIAGLLLHEVTQLLIGHLHGLYGILQRTDLLLCIERATTAITLRTWRKREARRLNVEAPSYHWDRFDLEPLQDPGEAIGGDVSRSLDPHGLQGRIDTNKI